MIGVKLASILLFSIVGSVSAFERGNGTIWALLVAGSNTWDNYRHQADVCHSWQVLREHGVQEKHIVTMMYDDIAENDENPIPGFIRNEPGGKNVYEGLKKYIDYKGEDVNPTNFIKVLSGDKELLAAGKKVINSGPDDHVFVYFADHGGPGIIAFPDDELDADTLVRALDKMSKKKRFNKLVFYMEACESGSMFQDLLKKTERIYATTAANSEESSYACFFDDQLETYLADVYSIKWLDDSDRRKSLKTETLAKQFKIVKNETTTSHVCEFGDLTIGKMKLSEFQGAKKSVSSSTPKERDLSDAVPSEDVPLHLAIKKFEKATDPMRKEQLRSELSMIIDGRRFFRRTMYDLAMNLSRATEEPAVNLVTVRGSSIDHSCYRELRIAFKEHCFRLADHPYALQGLNVLVNACRTKRDDVQVHHLADIIRDHCRDIRNPFVQIK